MPHVDAVSKFVASSGVSLEHRFRSEHLAGCGFQPSAISCSLAVSYGMPISGMRIGAISSVQPRIIIAIVNAKIFLMGPNA